jgi:hypothetical protein
MRTLPVTNHECSYPVITTRARCFSASASASASCSRSLSTSDWPFDSSASATFNASCGGCGCQKREYPVTVTAHCHYIKGKDTLCKDTCVEFNGLRLIKLQLKPEGACARNVMRLPVLPPAPTQSVFCWSAPAETDRIRFGAEMLDRRWLWELPRPNAAGLA